MAVTFDPAKAAMIVHDLQSDVIGAGGAARKG